MDNLLLQIKHLKIFTDEKTLVKDLNLDLQAGKTLGIVGESGSGKSLSSLAIMALLPNSLKYKGSILFNSKELLNQSEEDYQKIRGNQIAMIFQEPLSALNPSKKCGLQVAEVLKTHKKLSAKQIKLKVLKLFEEVELPEPKRVYSSYPHQLSGGQKQRIMIAMAIACKPKLLIADEPTTALDVSVQKAILNLLKKLQKDYGMAMLFISHDLGVVKSIADEILVLHLGEVKEYGKSTDVFENPQHPYTRGLLACRPTANTYSKRLPLVRDFLEDEQNKLEQLSKAKRTNRAKVLAKQHPLFEIKDISKIFYSKAGVFTPSHETAALNKVSLKIFPSESLGLVGESGSGKTTLGRILVGLEKLTSGNFFYQGKDISVANSKTWRVLHKKIQIIFQDPFASLNPRLKIGEAIAEVIKYHERLKKDEARIKAKTLLKKVGLLEEYYERYPHEFSGGQRQRIGIARALATQPEFIVCDESVSALDVSVQAQILNLLNDLKDEFGFTYLFISHDLNVVKYFCDRVVVLQKGKVVESGFSEELYEKPKESYTKELIGAGLD